jgi:hypothetical protein
LTRCKSCDAAYHREWRKTALAISVRQAKREGKEEALQAVRVALLEAGDTPLNGFTAAELVRRIGWD